MKTNEEVQLGTAILWLKKRQYFEFMSGFPQTESKQLLRKACWG